MSEKRTENKRVKKLKEQIADLTARFPAHSLPPAMLQELDDLEETLEKAMKEITEEEADA